MVRCCFKLQRYVPGENTKKVYGDPGEKSTSGKKVNLGFDRTLLTPTGLVLVN